MPAEAACEHEANDMAAIRAVQLRKTFGDRVAVDDLSLSVWPGQIYALVGPDGAGKTTVIRLICGALRADRGEVTLGGVDLQRHTEQALAQIGYLPQRFSLYGELTVMENLRFLAEVRGLPSKEWASRSKEILAFVELDAFAKRRAEKLSGGMRQKLGLAAALVHHPSILLLDEPSGGVDPVTRQSFWQLLIQLLGQGVAILMSTPYMDEASRCTRVGFIEGGRLMVEGSPAEIVQRMEGQLYEVTGDPIRLIHRVARGIGGFLQAQAFGDRLHLYLPSGERRDSLTALRSEVSAQGGTVRSIEPIEPSLEDAFLALLIERRQPTTHTQNRSHEAEP